MLRVWQAAANRAATNRASKDRAEMNEDHYPNPFSDVGKYTPQPLSRDKPESKALRFWEHPSPKKVIPIREG